MIIGNMATYPAREAVLQQTIESVAHQVDRLNVVFNEYQAPPVWMRRHSNVYPIIPASDLKDTGKFFPDRDVSADVVLFDDDISYPDGYVQWLLRWLGNLEASLECDVVVGTHGTIYADIFTGRQNERNVFVFWRALGRPRLVNQLGTGTVALRGRSMPSFDFMRGSERFVDVRFARHCRENGVALICLPREDAWIREQNTGNENLFQTFTSAWPVNVVREVQAIAGYGRLPLEVLMKLKNDVNT